MRIGAVEKLAADEACKAARKVLAKVELGEDPQGDKAAARPKAARTMKAVAEDFLAAKRVELRPATYRVTELYLLRGPYFKALHTAAITDITLADVSAHLTAITRNHSSITAAHARSKLSSLFAWAVGEGLCMFNPVVGSNKPQTSIPRERVLSDAELAAIWLACADDDFGGIVKLLILTGCRRLEIGGMRWSEVDLEQGALSLPKERVKNGHAHVVPLSQPALSILETLQHGDRDFVFGARSQRGFTSWGEAKLRLDSRLTGRVAEWRLHDLRRTAATRMADLGVLPHIIEAVLNHYSGHRSGVAGIYNRSPYERDKRVALDLWAAHVIDIVEGRAAKIVPLRA